MIRLSWKMRVWWGLEVRMTYKATAGWVSDAPDSTFKELFSRKQLSRQVSKPCRPLEYPRHVLFASAATSPPESNVIQVLLLLHNVCVPMASQQDTQKPSGYSFAVFPQYVAEI